MKENWGWWVIGSVIALVLYAFFVDYQLDKAGEAIKDSARNSAFGSKPTQ